MPVYLAPDKLKTVIITSPENLTWNTTRDQLPSEGRYMRI